MVIVEILFFRRKYYSGELESSKVFHGNRNGHKDFFMVMVKSLNANMTILARFDAGLLAKQEIMINVCLQRCIKKFSGLERILK